MSSLTRDVKTGKIQRLRITNAVVQYPALIEPRDERDLKPGTYGAQFIIKDEETVKLIKEYATEVVKEAVNSEWKKMPKKLVLPFAKGDDSKDVEVGGTILKTNSGFQPKLYIRRPGQRTIALDDNEEYYAGMIADADIVFKAFNVTGNMGVTCYLQAICKVGEGEPLYVSSAASFDVEDFTDDDSSSFDLDSVVEPKKAASKNKATANKPIVKEEILEINLDDFDLDEEEGLDDSDEGLTLEDLLK